jgi:hypothetical protein
MNEMVLDLQGVQGVMGADPGVESLLEEQEMSQLEGGLMLTTCAHTSELIKKGEEKVEVDESWKEAGTKKQMKRKNLVMATRQSLRLKGQGALQWRNWQPNESRC